MSDQEDLFGATSEPPPRPTRKKWKMHEMNITRFKHENGIVTWCHRHLEEPWTAYKAPPGHENRGPVEVISELAEWLDQNGYMTTAKTECEAVTMLCDARGVLMPMHLGEESTSND